MSLTARLSWAMGLVAALLVVAAVVVTRTTTDHLVDQLDHQLMRVAGPIVGAGPGLPLERPMVPPGGGGSAPDVDGEDTFSSVFVGTFDDGRLVTRLAPAGAAAGSAVPQLDAADAERLVDTDAIVTVGSDVAGTSYRVLVRTDAEGAITVLGVQMNDVDSAVDRLVLVLGLAGIAVAVVLALVTWWVLHLGVRPIRRMTTAATAVAAGDLSQRIPDAPSGSEAAELGEALNTMLERIEVAFAERADSQDRLRQFVADASHELRTPVTTIRGYAELHRVGGLADPAQLDAAMARTEAEAVRMGRLVEDLLELARLDQGRQASTEAVDLAAVATAVVTDVAVVHPERDVALTAGPAWVEGVPDQLHQVVANLVTNAVVHTPDGTAVRVTVESDPEVVRVAVADDGPGMSAEVARHAFERFYRADPSRSRASGGSGLGLAIVASIVEAHHGRVWIEPTAQPGPAGVGRGTTVVVELPARAAVPVGAPA